MESFTEISFKFLSNQSNNQSRRQLTDVRTYNRTHNMLALLNIEVQEQLETVTFISSLEYILRILSIQLRNFLHLNRLKNTNLPAILFLVIKINSKLLSRNLFYQKVTNLLIKLIS